MKVIGCELYDQDYFPFRISASKSSLVINQINHFQCLCDESMLNSDKRKMRYTLLMKRNKRIINLLQSL